VKVIFIDNAILIKWCSCHCIKVLSCLP